MRVVLLGAGGMLGHKLLQTLRVRFPATIATLRGHRDRSPLQRVELLRGDDILEGVDASDFAQLRSLLSERRPDVIVNCIGVIKQRDTAKAARPSIRINSLLPHELAYWAEGWGGRVIHFSTDCVFSGRKGGPYLETDPSDAGDLYGKSKFLGEVATDNALTLRTSIIGRELKHFASLLEWFLAQRGGTIRGFSRVIYSGLTTNHLSEIVADLIEHHPRLSGVYQLASDPINKYDLLVEVREAMGVDVTIERDVDVALDRSMLGKRFTEATGIVVKPWPQMIAELAADTTPYDAWR
ncbi:MAG: SDR family oxidoreductase [Myxococcales bacterium]|nr:SDR family oxidoreductase [Myxococcales bacterium]